MRRFEFALWICAVALLVAPMPAHAAAPCDAGISVGGGMAGVSPGPVGPPNSLGWDVGTGQCNGSFTVVSDPAFPMGALELGIRAEERREGPVAPSGPGDYTVMTGPDTTAPPAANRAWWNFQLSIAYGGDLADLDALALSIRTDVGPNLPSSPAVNLNLIRFIIDDRNNQPNATTGFNDLYQISQNPEFGWFTPTSDGDANPTGAFDYDAPGAWFFTLTAEKDNVSRSVSACFHTPGLTCAPPPRRGGCGPGSAQP